MTDAFPDYGVAGVTASISGNQPIGGSLKISLVEQYLGRDTILYWGGGAAAVGAAAGLMLGIPAMGLAAGAGVVGAVVGFHAGVYGSVLWHDLLTDPVRTIYPFIDVTGK